MVQGRVQGQTQAGDAARRMVDEVEADMVRLIAYVNDRVVPEVRRECSRGLRAAAEQLQTLAAQLDQGPHGRTGAGR